MPHLSHLTSCTPTKSNLYLANSLAAIVSEPDLYWPLKFQVLNFTSIFHCLILTKVRDTCSCFVTKPVFTVRNCQHLAQLPNRRTTSYRLSTTSYLIHFHLPSILETVPPSATWGLAMPWLQGPTYHGENYYFFIIFILITWHTNVILFEPYRFRFYHNFCNYFT